MKIYIKIKIDLLNIYKKTNRLLNVDKFYSCPHTMGFTYA